jgi:hypothetical protein
MLTSMMVTAVEEAREGRWLSVMSERVLAGMVEMTLSYMTGSSEMSLVWIYEEKGVDGQSLVLERGW